MTIPAYPYYTLIIDENKLNGPTMFGLWWRRVSMPIDTIDRKKTLSQKIGRKLGIVLISSSNGTKILTLGLDDSQLMQILDHATEESEGSQQSATTARTSPWG